MQRGRTEAAEMSMLERCFLERTAIVNNVRSAIKFPSNPSGHPVSNVLSEVLRILFI